MQCTVATNLHRRGATLPGPYLAQKGALERPRQGDRSNACFDATTSSCIDCETLLQSCWFVHDCMVGNLLAPGCYPNTTWSARVCWKDRSRTLTAIDALNATAVQSFIARVSLMHTRMALHGANEHSWLRWAISGQILARRGPLDAQERCLGGVRCAAAAVLLPAEKALCVH